MGEEGSGPDRQVTMRQINVTELTGRQKRRIFANCFSEGGFVAFDKKMIGGQTYYIFIYKR